MTYFFCFSNSGNESRTGYDLIGSFKVCTIDKQARINNTDFPNVSPKMIITHRIQGFDCVYHENEKDVVNELLGRINISLHLNRFKLSGKPISPQIRTLLLAHVIYSENIEARKKIIKDKFFHGTTKRAYENGKSSDEIIVLLKESYNEYADELLLKDISLLKYLKSLEESEKENLSEIEEKDVNKKSEEIILFDVDELLTPGAIKRERIEIEREPDGYLVPMKQETVTKGSSGAAEETALSGQAKGQAKGPTKGPASGPAAKASLSGPAKGPTKGPAAENSTPFDSMGIDEKIQQLKKLDEQKYDLYISLLTEGVDKEEALRLIQEPPEIPQGPDIDVTTLGVHKTDIVQYPTEFIGLINIGAWCYLNTIIQLLYMGFFKEILTFDIKTDEEEFPIDDFFIALYYVFCLLYKRSQGKDKMAVNINCKIIGEDGTNVLSEDRTLLLALFNGFTMVGTNAQQDESDFFAHIITLMNKSKNIRVRNLLKSCSFNIEHHLNCGRRGEETIIVNPDECWMELAIPGNIRETGDGKFESEDLGKRTEFGIDYLINYTTTPQQFSKTREVSEFPEGCVGKDTEYYEYIMAGNRLLFIHVKRALPDRHKNRTPIKPQQTLTVRGNEWELLSCTAHIGSQADHGHYVKVDLSVNSLRGDVTEIKINRVINDDKVLLGHEQQYNYLFNPSTLLENVSLLLYRKIERHPADRGGYKKFNKYMKYKLKYLKLKKMLANQ